MLPQASAGAGDADVNYVVENVPDLGAKFPAEFKAVREKLDAHAADMLEKWPLSPWLFTNSRHLYVHFGEKRQTLYALSLALPYLTEPTRGKALSLLKTTAAANPLGAPHYTWNGRKRFPFVGAPVETRAKRAKPLRKWNAFSPANIGYAAWTFWEYGDRSTPAKLMPALVKALRQFQSRPPEFKVTHQNDAPAALNRALSGVIGIARLARALGDRATERAARDQARSLMDKRIAMEDDPILAHPVDQTKHGICALVRYLDLTPGIGRIIGRSRDPKKLSKVIDLNAQLCPGWFLAWHERATGLANLVPAGQHNFVPQGQNKIYREYVGAESFLNDPILSRSIFAGKALVGGEGPEELKRFLDIPWCVGDLYYIEKCVWTLWSASGRRWRKVGG